MPSYVITNYIFNHGLTGNKINFAALWFDSNLITNITGVTSVLQGTNTYNRFSGELSIYYTNSIFPGQTNDVISMAVWEINTNTNFNISFSVSNDRWLTNNIQVTPGQSQNVAMASFPTLYSYSVYPTLFYNAGQVTTNQMMIFISNRGWSDNKIWTAQIKIPNMLSNKVIMVSNALLQATNMSGGAVTISGTNDIWINYQTGDKQLDINCVDTNYLWIVIDTNIVTNLSWTVGASNNHSFTMTNYQYMMGSGTSVMSLVKKPYGYITPNQVLTTTSFNNFLYNLSDLSVMGAVTNSGMGIGRPVMKFRIGLPAVFNQLLNTASGIPFTTISTYSANGSNFIELDYLNGLNPGGDQISFRANDTVANITNLYVSGEVDYGDGIGWRNTDIQTNYTNLIYFQQPAVQGSTYVTPATVYQDFPTNEYKFFIQNNGVYGNNIQKVMIIAPSYLTNCTSLTSLIMGAPAVTTGAGGIVTNTLFYTNTYTLSNNFTDWIYLIGYNGVGTNANTNGQWTVLADNTTNGLGLSNCSIIVGQTLSNSIVQPGYSAEVGIQATNSTTGGYGSTIYSTLQTNFLIFYVYNQSDQGTWITGLRIHIPSSGVLLNTNGIQITNLLKSTGVNNYISNETIYFDYSTNQIKSQEMDEIIIQLSGNMMNLNTNLTWSADASFNTTYYNYKPTTIYTGESLTINYTMPNAKAQGYAYPNYTSQDFPTNGYQIYITNTAAEPANNIYYARIVVPDAITNISGITNSNTLYSPVFATNSNMIMVYYTNNNFTNPLKTGSADIIQFIGSDNISNATYASNWNVYADNTTNNSKEQIINPISGYNFGLNIIRFPYSVNVYMIATNSVSVYEVNSIYSTILTDYLEFVLTNSSGTAGNNITYMQIQIPWAVNTNTLFITNLNRAYNVSNYISNNYIILDYSKSNIMKGEGDVVLIQFSDYVANISTNVYWTNVQAAFNTTYNQFKQAIPWVGRSLTFNYIMPGMNAQGYSYPNVVSQDYPTNMYSIMITNNSLIQGNSVYSLIIGYPGCLTNFTGITNLNSANLVKWTNTNSSIVLNFTNGGIKPGSYDIIDFIGYGSVKGGDDDIITNWQVWGDNSTDGSDETAVGQISNGFGLSVIKYPYGAGAGLTASNYAAAYDDNTIYTTAITDVLYFNITNTSGAAGNNIRYVRLKIPWSYKTNTMTVTRMGKTAGVTNYITNYIMNNITNRYLVLDYNISNLGYADYDEIGIKYIDRAVNVNTNAVWTAEAAFDTTYNLYKAVDGNMTVNYIMPPVKLQAYAYPNDVSVDYPSHRFRIDVTNAGNEEGNAIYAVKIVIPSGITNISGISESNTNQGVISYSAGSNILTVYYTNSNYAEGLAPGSIDEYRFTGWDGLTNGAYAGSWQVLGDNTTNGSGWANAGLVSGESFGITITNSGYGAQAYVVVTNGIDANDIYSTVMTNYLQLYITNISLTNDSTNENRLTKLRVSIPWVVDTNTLTVTDITRPSVTGKISNGYIILDYTSNNIQAGQSDIIGISYASKAMNINTNAVWGLDALYNSTYTNYKPATMWPGNSLTIQYIMPSVNARGYASPTNMSQDYPTNGFVIFITNTSSEPNNTIYRLRITGPDAITNINYVTDSNTSLGMNYSISSNSNNNIVLILYYTNNNFSNGIGNGQQDYIGFTAYSALNGASTNYRSNWIVSADNTTNWTGEKNVSVINGSNYGLNIIKYPYASKGYMDATNSISPMQKNNIYSTLTTNFLEFVITNISGSVDNTGNNIKSVKIGIPQISAVITGISNLIKTNGVNISTNGGYIEMDYSESNMIKNNDFDIVRIVLNNNVMNSNITLNWTNIGVLYDTTYTNYKPITPWQLYSSMPLTFNYIMPGMNAQGYSYPNVVSQDYPTNMYSIMITNNSLIQGNSVYSLIIGYPGCLTNFTGITNLNSANLVKWTNTNSSIVLNFTNGGIKPGSYDIIDFIGYGSVKGGDDDIITNWQVWGDNSTDGSDETAVGQISNGFGLSVIKYPYGAGAGLTASNYAAAYDDNTIYTTAITDVLYFNITNTSGAAGNNIRYVRLKIPWSYKTNTMTVTRMGKTAGVTNYITNYIMNNITNRYLVLDYNISNLGYADYDEIGIKYIDRAVNVNTNAVWTAEAAFDTTYNLYKAVDGNMTVNYIMPPVKLQAYAYPNDVSVDYPSHRFRIDVTNAGNEEGNAIYAVKIVIPSGITNISGISESNTNQGVISYSAGSNILTVYYTNSNYAEGLAPGSIDEYRFTGWDGLTNGAYAGSWQVLGDNTTNGSGWANAGLVSGESFGITITNSGYGAQAYVVVTNGIDANDIYSTVMTNYLQLYITNISLTNDSTNENRLTKLRVSIPWVVDTNTLTVTDITRPSVTGKISNGYIILDYTSNNIQAGQSDIIGISYASKAMNINTNAVWGLDALYNSTYTNYKPATMWPGNSLTIQYIMPSVNAVGYSFPNRMPVDFPKTNYTIFVSNTATNIGNNIFTVKIAIPASITNIVGLTNSNTNGRIVYLNNSNLIMVYYTNNNYTSGLKIGDYDSYQFTGNNLVTNTPFYGNWQLTADNTTNGSGYKSVGVMNGASFVLSITNFGYNAYAYIIATNSIDSINKNDIYSTITTNYLILYITNSSTSNENSVEKVRVLIPWAVDTNTLIVSNLIKTHGVSNYISNNYIILDYSVSNLLQNDFDEIMIKFNDKVFNSSTNVIWNVEARYNTTYYKYKTVNLWPGNYSLTINYDMPGVNAGGNATPNTVSQDFPSYQYQVLVTNMATEPENDIYSIKIKYPGFFTNITGVTNLNTNYQVNINNSNNIITLNYTNTGIIRGSYDVIEFICYGNIKYGDSDITTNWQVWADNTTSGTQSTAVAALSGCSFGLNILKYPYLASVYMVATNSVSQYDLNTIYSTVVTDYLNFIVTNQSGASGNNISLVKLQIPDIVVTNTLKISNLVRNTGVSNYISNGYIVLDYSGSNIQKNEWDSILIQFADNVANTNITVYWTNITAAFNTSFNEYRPVMLWPGKNLYFNYAMPPVRAEGFANPNIFSQDFPTNQCTLWITNSAFEPNNNIYFLNIAIPSVITNIFSISNYNTNYLFAITTNSNILQISYTNGGIIPGGFDRISFIGRSSLTGGSSNYNTNWQVWADNSTDGSDSAILGAISNGFGLSIIRYPYDAEVDINGTNGTSTLYSTITTNYLEIIVTNKSSATGNNLQMVRIKIPGAGNLIDTNSIKLNNLSGISYFTNYQSNGYIILDYRSNSIVPGAYDAIYLQAIDLIMNSSTNLNWTSEAAFDSTYSIFKTADGSQTIGYQMPQPSAVGSILPNEFSRAYPSIRFNLFISNTAVEKDITGLPAGNNIYLSMITIPSAITNINSISNSNTNSPAVFVLSNNTLLIYYTNNGFTKGLNQNNQDVISFNGVINTLTNNFNGQWQVNIFNTTNFIGGNLISGLSNGVFALNIMDYPALGYADIISTQPVNYDNNTIYSTIRTNYLQMRFYDVSPSDNSITGAEITIPGGAGLYNTNSLVIPFMVSNNVVSNDWHIWLDLSTNAIQVSSNLVIPIQLIDTINHTETNLTWSVSFRFDKNYLTYIPAAVTPMKSLGLKYVMPVPSVNFTTLPSELYLLRTNLTIQYQLSNTGTGDNDVDRVMIYIPTNFQVASFTSIIPAASMFITNISGSNWIDLQYNPANPLYAGKTDTVTLTLSQQLTNAAILAFDLNVRNYVNTGEANGNFTLNVSAMPVFYITPNNVDTTSSSNVFQIYIYNNNWVRNLTNIQLKFPDIFTNYAYDIQNSKYKPSISGTITNLQLVYTNNNQITIGDYDVIKLVVWDKLDSGYLTNGLNALIIDEFGYLPMNLMSGYSSNFNFNMPAPVTLSYINPSAIFVTTTTNKMSVSITNLGSGSSSLSYVRIDLPSLLGNINNIVSAKGGVGIYSNSSSTNFILINYGTNLVRALDCDTVTFNFSNGINVITNLGFSVYTANLTNNPVFSVSPGVFGSVILMQVVDPPLAAYGYFYENSNTMYLLENNASLIYRLQNRTPNTELTQAVISFDPYLFSNISNNVVLKSTNSKAVITSSGSNYTISYPRGLGLQYTYVDDIEMDINYNFSTITTNFPVKSKVWVYGATNSSVDTITIGQYVSYMSITNLNCGAVSGNVFPALKPVNISLYYPGTKVKANNTFGIVLVGEAKNGNYYISRIVPGKYDIEYSASYYKTLRLSNVNVISNIISMVSIVTMKNAALTPGDMSGQTVLCYDNTNTRVLFPPNSLGKSFSLDIKKIQLNEKQVDNINSNPKILSPSSTENMTGYELEMFDDNNNLVQGSVIQLDAVLYLAYYKTTELDLNADNTVTTNIGIDKRGWDEQNLAIYYWDDTKIGSHWVRVGGTIDAANNVVVAKVGYIHNMYAIMGKKDSGNDNGEIRNVEVRPKIFTPTKDANGYFGNVRITFDLKDQVDSYEIKIYNIKGNLIRDYKREGGYSQGEIDWDATDGEGYPVKSGVYIYRVIANNTVYAGTIIVAR